MMLLQYGIFFFINTYVFFILYLKYTIKHFFLDKNKFGSDSKVGHKNTTGNYKNCHYTVIYLL